VWEQDIGVFPVHFEQQGDEWFYHLAVELIGDGHMAACGTDGKSPVEFGPPHQGDVTSKLYVRPHADGISCAVAGKDKAARAGTCWTRGAHGLCRTFVENADTRPAGREQQGPARAQARRVRAAA
jgi:hypothetical protein